MFVAALFITAKKVDTSQMLTSWCMDEPSVVYPYNGMRSTSKGKEALIHAVTERNLQNIMLSEVSQI